MDAAQMLTAQEIARQCEHMARIAEQRRNEPGPASDRSLRLVDPITEPIERIGEPAPEAPQPPEPTAEGRGRTRDLSAQERGILAFERQWWKRSGAKERAIRELFDMSVSRYYEVLDTLVDAPEALRADPMLIKRLRRARDGRPDPGPAPSRGAESPHRPLSSRSFAQGGTENR
ncbi:uncharacterized protein DUF3263 [Halopolyspora algeriensis]|uniref:Uncharacterized protein DUF3263 n=1 Tax=Halopolyspora algeriensis TaxID=1500506 RepID=A0A368VPA8_9ACTN|nr:DUF3263 domain-containing protein [Halopolyspora algeriensis]RCW43559.1 uncharacterized protein DUF3263 [Halopolyspora algeriensis]TQM47656.1 uncharacterized protein DUF3263 [Halopolyspora algeriensis]